MLIFEGTEISALIRLGAVSALLVAVIKAQGWLVLFALQTSLFLREPSRPEMEFGLVPWIYGTVSLAIVGYSYLGSSFRNRVSHWIIEQTMFALGVDARADAKPLQTEAPDSSWLQLLASSSLFGLEQRCLP